MNAQFTAHSSWLESAPQRIAAVGLAMAVSGLAIWAAWLATGDAALLDAFFRYPNALATITICAAEVLLSFEAWRRFEPANPLRPAWLWLSLAALTHLIGRIMALPGSTAVAATQTMSMNEVGRIVGGPIQMSLLLAGLLHVVANCRRLKLLRGLTALDYVLLVAAGGLLLRTFGGISQFVGAGKTVTFTTAALWTSDPLLFALLAVAVLIRRSVARLGHGLLANCWRSFVAAIVLTFLAGASTWCLDCTTTPIWTSFGWFLWIVADTAFALGPAFQVAALEHARNRARLFQTFSDLAFWRVP